MRYDIEHPVITQMERFGYVRESECDDYDEDRAYDERRECDMFGNA